MKRLEVELAASFKRALGVQPQCDFRTAMKEEHLNKVLRLLQTWRKENVFTPETIDKFSVCVDEVSSIQLHPWIRNLRFVRKFDQRPNQGSPQLVTETRLPARP